MQRPHQDQKVLEINRGEEALESDGGKVEEPVPVLDSFPVLLLPQDLGRDFIWREGIEALSC